MSRTQRWLLLFELRRPRPLLRTGRVDLRVVVRLVGHLEGRLTRERARRLQDRLQRHMERSVALRRVPGIRRGRRIDSGGYSGTLWSRRLVRRHGRHCRRSRHGRRRWRRPAQRCQRRIECVQRTLGAEDLAQRRLEVERTGITRWSRLVKENLDQCNVSSSMSSFL